MPHLQRADGAGHHRPDVRLLEVLDVEDLTARMRRIVLGGPAADGLTDGANVKLVLPLPAGGRPGPWCLADGDAEPAPVIVRTYTVRDLDDAAGRLTVDFVRHRGGVAGDWAEACGPGSTIGVAGIGGLTVRPADTTLLVGDETAVPAIGRILERSAAGLQGTAIIEVGGPEDEVALDVPPDVEVRWVHRGGAPAGSTDLLPAAVRAWPWPDAGSVFAWVGAESRAVREIRSHLRERHAIGRRDHLAIGYWRRGMDEDRYHAEHDNDRDADYYEAARELAEAR